MTPKSKVGRFAGAGVHGAGGEYRYDHEYADVVVYVHPHEPGDGWAVSVDENQAGRPGTLLSGMEKDEAFEFAYRLMRNYETGPAEVPDDAGRGQISSDFDFFGGGL